MARLGGIEAGGSKFVCAAGSSPEDCEFAEFPTTTPQETIGPVIDFFRARAPVAALGIASFGPIDPNPDSPTFGYITSTPKLAWRNFDFAGTVGRALQTPIAFDSSATIAGGALPSPDAFSGTPSVAPTNVDVFEGGVPTATSQLSLTASTASSATVLMSEGIVTEVTFTVDPVPPAPTVTAAPSAAPVAAQSTDAAVLAKVEKQLSSAKAEIKALTKKLSSKHLSKAARKADTKKLAALRALERKLLKELK